VQALIGLGGNLGTLEDLTGRFIAVVDQLRARLPVAQVRASGLYRSDPVGPVVDQPRFVNAVLALELARPVTPLAIMTELLAVEVELGRIRNQPTTTIDTGNTGETGHKGPRTIDLDLLFVDRLVLADPGPPALVLPHPGACQRAFVLMPLAELLGEAWPMPGVDKTIAECLATDEVRAQAIERVLNPGGESWLQHSFSPSHRPG
jgi:2-amino-4-hydroxy-6-hydroxymethyldihydropteridine diphosphokinase